MKTVSLAIYDMEQVVFSTVIDPEDWGFHASTARPPTPDKWVEFRDKHRVEQLTKAIQEGNAYTETWHPREGTPK